MEMRSHCPINFGVEIFGDKWSLLIVRDLLFFEKRHYNEFFESDEKISTSVLGDKLRALEENGIITRKNDTVKKSRIRYSLTEKGISLLPMMLEMILWSATYDKVTKAPPEFIAMVNANKQGYIAETEKKLREEHL